MAPRLFRRSMMAEMPSRPAWKRPCTLRRSRHLEHAHAHWLGSGLPAARSDDRLPLLPSGSDGVHGPFLHRTRSSTPPRVNRIRDVGPREGIQPRWSGLRVQGTASSPLSTTVTMVSRDRIQRPSLVLVFGTARQLSTGTQVLKRPGAGRRPRPGSRRSM